MAQLNAQSQREFALDVARLLREQGYTAFWAGGCVRDLQLGRPPKDYDVATDALPEQIKRVFWRRRTLDIGAAFGVIAVVGPRGAGAVEVTTFRCDANYTDARRPDAVRFSSPEEDAQRRDFTINGMFYDPLADRVIDYVGGLADLLAGVVRAIGDPQARFHEDRLRLLRAIRFAVTFDFVIEPSTRQALAQLAPGILAISPERIAQELRAMLVLPGRAIAAQLLADSGLLAVVLPELAPFVGDDRLWDETRRAMALLDKPGFPLSWATLLAMLAPAGDANQPAIRQAGESVENMGRRLRLANKEIERARWLVEHHASLVGARGRPWSQVQPLLAHEGASDLVNLLSARAAAGLVDLDDAEFCRDRLRLPPEELNPPPLVTGDDLIRHGVRPGVAFKKLLETVRAAQLNGQIANKADGLALADQVLSAAPAPRPLVAEFARTPFITPATARSGVRMNSALGPAAPTRLTISSTSYSCPPNRLPTGGRGEYGQGAVRGKIGAPILFDGQDSHTVEIDYLGLVLRWMHILAATAAAGGTFFMRLALLPSVSVLPDEHRKALHEQVRSRWSKVVMLSIGFLLVSGLINVALTLKPPGRPPLYHMLFTLKFLLALAIFFVASALMGRSPALARIRQNARFWLSLNAVLVTIVICLSGVLRDPTQVGSGQGAAIGQPPSARGGPG